MRDELSKVINPSGPSATIGERGVRLHQRALHRRVDFYDTAGRMHGLIALAPILYGLVQIQRGQALQPWFWWMVVATICFAWFGRRAPCLRLSPNGISFPDKKSPIHPWDQMCEAHSRQSELDILMADGRHVTISYQTMRAVDVGRLKRLVKSQFQIMANTQAVARAA